MARIVADALPGETIGRRHAKWMRQFCHTHAAFILAASLLRDIGAGLIYYLTTL